MVLVRSISSICNICCVLIAFSEITKIHDPSLRGQYATNISLGELASACHLRTDDAGFALEELSFLRHRRQATGAVEKEARKHDLGEWQDVRVIVSLEMVDEMWEKWKVREKGVLLEECMLL